MSQCSRPPTNQSSSRFLNILGPEFISAMCAWRNCCVSRSSGAVFIRMHLPCPICDPLGLNPQKCSGGACTHPANVGVRFVPSVEEDMLQKKVVIDCFPESVETYRNGYAIVAVDVIRATTTAV